jgi:hypothetical protein
MSGEETHPLDEQQLRARASVRGLSRPEARAEFRESLRASFMDSAQRPLRARRGWAPRPWQLLAAAAVFVFFSMNRPAAWRVIGSEGVAQVLVDGRLVPVDRLQEELRPGRRLQLPGPGRLDLASAGTLFFQLEDRIELTLPRSPARWIGRRVDATVAGSGRLRVMTGDAFAGARLSMRSEIAEWEVTGTCFTVIANEGLLCLCVLEGDVRACPPGMAMTPIPSGQRATFVASVAEVDHGAMRDDERVALTALAARADEFFNH